jgi:hypothetical protein
MPRANVNPTQSVATTQNATVLSTPGIDVFDMAYQPVADLPQLHTVFISNPAQFLHHQPIKRLPLRGTGPGLF